MPEKLTSVAFPLADDCRKKRSESDERRLRPLVLFYSPVARYFVCPFYQPLIVAHQYLTALALLPIPRSPRPLAPLGPLIAKVSDVSFEGISMIYQPLCSPVHKSCIDVSAWTSSSSSSVSM